MVKVDLNKLDLNEFIAKENPGQRCKATFPMFAAHGTKESATVYFELDPVKNLVHIRIVRKSFFLLSKVQLRRQLEMKRVKQPGVICFLYQR